MVTNINPDLACTSVHTTLGIISMLSFGFHDGMKQDATKPDTYQQSVAKTIPANKKWKNTTEVIVRAACEALSPYLQGF